MTDKIIARLGDSREVLKEYPDNHFDSCSTDPPYALASIVKRFGKPGSAPARGNEAFARTSAGFMGQQWDTGEAAFDPDFWRGVYRVLKPGAFLTAFSGDRTYHRLGVAIEDAGFEIRGMIAWTYGSGLPKSHDISKMIDKAAGAVREVVSQGTPVKRMIPGADQNESGWEKTNGREYVPTITKPATPEAQEWEGWGTALKPAFEPICLARKPLAERTVAANVLKWGTGALNIDSCRIETRWPANLAHDGSDDVVALFPDSGGQQGEVRGTEPSGKTGSIYGRYAGRAPTAVREDDGSAARFFYTAKADLDDRLGSGHPTVKPLDLMQWLVRMTTRPGGIVLEPFAGSGTTGEAAFREGMACVMIEREATFHADIMRRIGLMESSAAERRREAIKEKIRTGRIKKDRIAPSPLFPDHQ